MRHPAEEIQRTEEKYWTTRKFCVKRNLLKSNEAKWTTSCASLLTTLFSSETAKCIAWEWDTMFYKSMGGKVNETIIQTIYGSCFKITDSCELFQWLTRLSVFLVVRIDILSQINCHFDWKNRNFKLFNLKLDVKAFKSFKNMNLKNFKVEKLKFKFDQKRRFKDSNWVWSFHSNHNLKRHSPVTSCLQIHTVIYFPAHIFLLSLFAFLFPSSFEM